VKNFKIILTLLFLMAPRARAVDNASLPSALAISTVSVAPLPSFSWVASSSPVTVGLIIKRLASIEGQIKTLSAHFDQTVNMKEAGLTQKVVGFLDYSRPKRFNIKQTLPELQRIISDGTNIWVWRPSKKQVIKMPLSDWGKSQPFAQGLLDFGHYSEMLKNYQVKIVRTTSLSGALKDYQEITLLLTSNHKPSRAQYLSGKREGEDSSLKQGRFSLHLKLNTRNFFPFESEFQQDGIFVRSRFSHIVYNIALSSSEFHFDPPPDAQVFDGVFGGH